MPNGQTIAEHWLRWIAAASWQLAMLVALIALAALLSRRLSARFRYALWSLVLLKVFLWPGLAAPWSMGQWAVRPLRERVETVVRSVPRAASLGGATVSTTLAPAAPAPRERTVNGEPPAAVAGADGPTLFTTLPTLTAFSMEQTLMLAWLVGIALFLGLVALRYLRALALLRRAERVEEGPLRVALTRLSLELGRENPPDLLLSDRIASPFLMGLWRTRIVLPADLPNRLAPAEMEDVLRHELVHWRRRDLWVGWFQVLAQAFYWFHPLIWWANAQLRHERECACDEGVLAAGRRAAGDYAESLLRVLLAARGRGSAALGFIGIFEQNTKLQKRLGDIMNQETRIRRFGLAHWALLILFAAATLPMAAQSVEKSGDKPKPQHWVRVVVGKDAMTFEGNAITLEKLPTALEKVPDRSRTVLEYAYPSRETSRTEVMYELVGRAHYMGFAYLSDIGVHPLGSYGVNNTPDTPKLVKRINVDTAQSPAGDRLTIQIAAAAICEAAGIPFDKDTSAKLADPERQRNIPPLKLSEVMAEQALLDVLNPVGLRFDLGPKGLFLHRHASVSKASVVSMEAPQPAPEPQLVSGPPRVIATAPANGAQDVDSTLKEIAVTFDRDMTTAGYSWVRFGPTFPPTPGIDPFWRDNRTCVMPVTLQAGHSYLLGVNDQNYQNFQSAAGVAAVPFVLEFRTAGKIDPTQVKPQIVSMDPPNGATDVDPNLKEIRVTFDMPMGGGCSWTGGGEHFPTIPDGQRPRWSDDQKTAILPVVLKPGRSYRLGLNSSSFKNFQSAAGVPLEPVNYSFSTKP
jgi:beta-lactamase regulating signal transducer with metallopeptidase domain